MKKYIYKSKKSGRIVELPVKTDSDTMYFVGVRQTEQMDKNKIRTK